MDAEKRKRYENIASELTRLAGGRNNTLGIAHCATRLRLVLEDNDKADIHAIEDVDLEKASLSRETSCRSSSGQVLSMMCARSWPILCIWTA